MSTRKKVSIYSCGGAGIEIGRLLKASIARSGQRDQLALHDIYFIDSSDSNAQSGSPETTYLIPGMDGAGKDREIIKKIAMREAPNILQRFPPSDINIMISSSSGASGAVIRTALTEKIWAEGKEVSIFSIGSSESRKACENVLADLKTLNGIARVSNRVSVLSFEDNGAKTQNPEVDEAVIQGVTAMLDLYSGHRGLDTKDVEQWLNLGSSAKLAPQLVLMDIDTSYDNASKRKYPVAVAMLYGNEDEARKPIPADYVTEGWRKEGDPNDSLFFSIHTDGLNELVEHVEADISAFIKKAATRDSLNKNHLDSGTDDNGWA